MKNKFAILALGLLTVTSLFAETFYGKYRTLRTEDWKDWNNWENWGIWNGGEGENPDQLVPGADDYINAGNVEWGNASHWFNLGGETISIKGIDGGFDDPQVHNRFWHLTNGTLQVTATWSNNTFAVTQYAGSKMIWAATSHTALGQRKQVISHTILKDAELQILGTVEQCRGDFYVRPGGKLVLDPVFFGGETNLFGNSCRPTFYNEGLVTMPNGFKFQGFAPDWDGYQNFVQTNGTLEVGGKIKQDSSRCRLNLYFHGGTIHATGAFSFGAQVSGLSLFEFVDDAAVTINVDEGASADFTNATFGDNVVFTKAGPGPITFGSTKPSALVVANGGTYAPSANAALGDSFVSLQPGSTLCLAYAGVTADAISGIDEETVQVTVASTTPSGVAIFSSTDETLLATVCAKLTASSSSVGSFKVKDGGVIFERAHEATVFSWKTENTDNWYNDPDSVTNRVHQDYMNPSSWAVGRSTSGTNPDSLIPSAGDSIYISDTYQPLFKMNMNGESRFLTNQDKTGYSEKWGFNGWAVKNGSLTFTGEFKTTRGYLIPHANGKIAFSETSTLRLGSGGAQAYAYVQDSGELSVKGKVSLGSGFFGYVRAGGKMVLSPVDGCLSIEDASYVDRLFENAGTFELPVGLEFSGHGNSAVRLRIEQKAGVLNLGGTISHPTTTAPTGEYRFLFLGGTLHATDDATITNLTEISMPADASATVEVDAGKTLDLSQMVFGDNTTLVKTGLGTLLLGASRPTALDVQAGTIAYKTSTAIDASLTLAVGTTLAFADAGCVVSAAPIGLDGAYVRCLASAPSGKLLTAATAELTETLLSKLNASSSSVGTFTLIDGAIYFDKAHAETTFSWKHEGNLDYNNIFDLSYSTYTVYPFADADSWAVGTSASGTNPDGLVPGEADWLYYGDTYKPIYAMDLQGQTRTIKGFSGGLTSKETWGFRSVVVSNGTLKIAETFTGSRFAAYAVNGGTIIHDETAKTQSAQGSAQCYWVADDGGTIDLRGSITNWSMQSVCKVGGTMTVDLSEFYMKGWNGSNPETYFDNSGTMNFPNGLTLTGTGSSASSWGRCQLYQRAGVMTLGGDVSIAKTVYGNIWLHLYGGTLRATNDVSFASVRSIDVEEDCTATLEVAEGKVFDASLLALGIQFGENAKLIKDGAGALVLGSSLAGALEVQGGAVRCATTALADNLTLTAGGTLVLTGSGVSATAIGGLDVGSITIADTFKYGVVFTSTNAELLSSVFAKLRETIAADDTLTIVGNQIWYESAHPSTVFSWKPVLGWLDGKGYWYKADWINCVTGLYHRSYVDPSFWSLGRTTSGGNPDGVIPQASDDLYISDAYEPLFPMDMKGHSRKLRNYDKTGYSEKWGFNGFSIKNGTLEFTGTMESTRGYFFVSDAGRLVFGPTSTTVFGNGGAETKAFIYSGSEIVYQGDVSFKAVLATIYAGGKMTIDPTDAELKCPYSSYATQFIDNSGTLSLPHGLTITGYGNDDRTMTITQRAGSTLELGGSLTKLASVKGPHYFVLEGGTITVTENAAISGFTSCAMADGASVSVNVAAGKTLDLSEMTFGSNTTVTNTGTGRIRFGESRPTTYVNPNVKPSYLILW